MSIRSSAFLYPTNNFGHHNNVHFYYYGTALVQGKYYYNFQQSATVQIRNELFDDDVEIVKLDIETGRLDSEAYTTSGKVLRPGNFYNYTLVASNFTRQKAVRGSVTVRTKRGGRSYTLAFEVDFSKNHNIQGAIQENPNGRQVLSKLGQTPKQQQWGSFNIQPASNNNPGKLTLSIGK